MKSDGERSSVRDTKAEQKFVACPFREGKSRIRFYPHFGQVFYHRADGTQIADEDGIVFDEKVLESTPPVIAMILKNKEG